MNTPSGPMRCLLDKNIVRYALTGLLYGRLRPLSPLERGALSFWRTAEQQGTSLFISPSTFHVLESLARYDEVQLFLDSAAVLYPTRYHARWARRIRETTGLRREDAALAALATFSTDEAGDILGAHCLLTYDRPLVNGYEKHLAALQRRLRAMTVQLTPPFNYATLPRLVTPDEFST